MQPEHRIDELIVDLSFTTTRLARHEKALLVDWLSEDLLPALDQLFSRYSPGQQILRFETLEFDFGNLTSRNYQQNICEQLLQKFAQLLQTQLLAVTPAHRRLPEHANSGDNPNARVALTQLLKYLASGQLSAHQPFEQPTNPAGHDLTDTTSTKSNDFKANTGNASPLKNNAIDGEVTADNTNKKYAKNYQSTDGYQGKKISKHIVREMALHQQLLDAVIAQQNIAELLRELPQRDALIQRLLTQFSGPQRLELLRQLAPQHVQRANALLDLLQLFERSASNTRITELSSHLVWQSLLQLGLAYPQASVDFWLRHILHNLSASVLIDEIQLQQYLTAIKIPTSSAAAPLIELQAQLAQLAQLSTKAKSSNDEGVSVATYPAESNVQAGVQDSNPEQLRQIIAAAFIRTDISQLQQLWPQLIEREPNLLLAALQYYLPQAEIRQQLTLRLPLVLQADIIALLAPPLKNSFNLLQNKATQLIESLKEKIDISLSAEDEGLPINGVKRSEISSELLLRQLWEIALGLLLNNQSAAKHVIYSANDDVFLMALAARYAELHNVDVSHLQRVFHSLLMNYQDNSFFHKNYADSQTALSNDKLKNINLAKNYPKETGHDITRLETDSLSSISDHQLFDLCLRLKSGALAWSSLGTDIPLLQRMISSYIRLGHSATAENCADFVGAIDTQAQSSRSTPVFYLAVLQTLIADKLIDLDAIALSVQRSGDPFAAHSHKQEKAQKNLRAKNTAPALQQYEPTSSSNDDVAMGSTTMQLEAIALQLQYEKINAESLDLNSDQLAQLVDIFIALDATIPMHIKNSLIIAVHQQARHANRINDYYRRVLTLLIRKELPNLLLLCEQVNQQVTSGKEIVRAKLLKNSTVETSSAEQYQGILSADEQIAPAFAKPLSNPDSVKWAPSAATVSRQDIAQPTAAAITALNNFEAIAQGLLSEPEPVARLQKLQLDVAQWQNLVAELILQSQFVDKDASTDLIDTIQNRSRQVINAVAYYRLVIAAVLAHQPIDLDALAAASNQQNTSPVPTDELAASTGATKDQGHISVGKRNIEQANSSSQFLENEQLAVPDAGSPNELISNQLLVNSQNNFQSNSIQISTASYSATTESGSQQSMNTEINPQGSSPRIITADNLSGIVHALLADSDPVARLQTLQLDLAQWQGLVAELIQQSQFVSKDASVDLIDAVRTQSRQVTNAVAYYRLVILAILAHEPIDLDALAAAANNQPTMSLAPNNSLSASTGVAENQHYINVRKPVIEQTDSNSQLVETEQLVVPATGSPKKLISNQLLVSSQNNSQPIASQTIPASATAITESGSQQSINTEIIPQFSVPPIITAGNLTPVAQALLAEADPVARLQTLQLDVAQWQGLVAELIQLAQLVDTDADLIDAIQNQLHNVINPARYYRLVIAAVLARAPIDLEAVKAAANKQHDALVASSATGLIADHISANEQNNSQPISASISTTTSINTIAHMLLAEPQSWLHLQHLGFDDKQWHALLIELIQQSPSILASSKSELIDAIQLQARRAFNTLVYYRLVIKAVLEEQPIDLDAFAVTDVDKEQSRAIVDLGSYATDHTEGATIVAEQHTQVDDRLLTAAQLNRKQFAPEKVGTEQLSLDQLTTDQFNPDQLNPNQFNTEQLSVEPVNTEIDNSEGFHSEQLVSEELDSKKYSNVPLNAGRTGSEQFNIEKPKDYSSLTGSDNSLRKAALSLAQLLAAALPLNQEQLLALQQHINTLLNRPNRTTIAEWRELLAVAQYAQVLVHSVPAHLLHQIAMRLQADRYAWLDAVVKLVMEALALLVSDINNLAIKQARWEFTFNHLFTANSNNSNVAEASARAAALSMELCAQLASVAGIDDVQRLVNLTQRRIALLKPPAQQKPAMRLQDISTNPATHSDASTPQWEAGLHINNAGQVLAAAFLPRLFSMLNLMQDGKFIHLGAADRAVHLVQFMVTGQSATPEYELILNKILCGIGTSIPVSAGIEITEQEQTLIEQMLTSMIQHWKVLGSTSITGLRETFFQRQGWLVLEEDCWRLKVKEQTFDLLLDRLPWSISLIKHGWMDKPLRVSWRNHS